MEYMDSKKYNVFPITVPGEIKGKIKDINLKLDFNTNYPCCDAVFFIKNNSKYELKKISLNKYLFKNNINIKDIKKINIEINNNNNLVVFVER